MTDRQERYLDRELSWLQFNRRVQSLTQREDFPLLERLRFAAITASNLEEFFSVRVSGVERKLAAEVDRVGFTGIEPKVLLQRIRREVVRQEHQLQQLVAEQLLPGLAGHGLRVARIDELSPAEREEVAELFWHEVVPELTPVPFSVDWNFPPLRNLSLGVVAQLRRRGDDQYAFVGVPAHLQRFLQLADGRTFVALEHVMVALLPELFKRARVTGSTVIRVVRDMDVEFDEESIEDPASARRRIERGLRERGSGNVVRLQVLGDGVPQIWPQLRRVLGVKRRHLYAVPTFVALDSFLQLVDTPGFDELRLPRIRPAAVPRLEQSDSASMFEEIARKDVLLHHPYNDFSTTVERFERTAVEDPDVLAIKHTLYRTSANSSVVPALIAARNRHRRAVCLVELKARFDELSNLQLARELEHAAVQVSYGDAHLKTHAKVVLVVRREGDEVRRYAHIGTGNYDARTARIYEDVGLLTADEEITEDVADFFLWTTDQQPRPTFRHLLVSPLEVRSGIVARIRRAAEVARAGGRASIRIKLNSIADVAMADDLYAASSAGVQIDLVVRGICCVRPGVPGMSENIRVISVVGRVLEHSRIYCFEYDDEVEVFIGSADLMERNLDRRIEVLAPVRQPEPRDELRALLDRYVGERIAAWELDSTGRWAALRGQSDDELDIHADLERIEHER